MTSCMKSNQTNINFILWSRYKCSRLDNLNCESCLVANGTILSKCPVLTCRYKINVCREMFSCKTIRESFWNRRVASRSQTEIGAVWSDIFLWKITWSEALKRNTRLQMSRQPPNTAILLSRIANVGPENCTQRSRKDDIKSTKQCDYLLVSFCLARHAKWGELKGLYFPLLSFVYFYFIMS